MSKKKDKLAVHYFTLNLKQIAAICFLVERNGGIGKVSPNYLAEKSYRMEHNSSPFLILDSVGQKNYFSWVNRWTKFNEKEDVDSRPAPTLPGVEGCVKQDND